MREIKLLKNNQDREWEDLQWIEEFSNFLCGQIPEGMSIGRGHKLRLTAKQANTIIWYLQEHFSILPDHIEQCDTCGEWYDSDSQGHYSELTGKCYCNESCEPRGLYEREERAAKRKDAPFQKWFKQVKKNQKHYPALKDKELSETAMRGFFNREKTPIDALNDVITLV